MKSDAPTKTRRRKDRLKAIEAQIPVKLHEQLRRLVDEGWYRDEQQIVDEALRRFLSTHTPEMLERAFREDVAWGLRGGK